MTEAWSLRRHFMCSREELTTSIKSLKLGGSNSTRYRASTSLSKLGCRASKTGMGNSMVTELDFGLEGLRAKP